ncbi:MAG: hypothetical protein ACOH2Q_20090 [Rhodococcus sp. (in: high G+C Gram-positive bacteria)]
MIMLTDDERKLLHEPQVRSRAETVIAAPEYGITQLRQSYACGGGHGFDYEVTKTSIDGWWSNYEVVKRLPDGSPSLLRFDEPHLRVSITFTRLRQWATSLPAELRERALIARRTYPVDTRDLAELARIAHEAIDLSAPAEQLELFEVA